MELTKNGCKVFGRYLTLALQVDYSVSFLSNSPANQVSGSCKQDLDTHTRTGQRAHVSG